MDQVNSPRHERSGAGPATGLTAPGGVPPAQRREATPSRVGNPSLARLGFWSSVAVVVASLGFSVPGLLGIAGVLGFPWDPVLPDGFSLVLSMAFLAMMVALHFDVPEIERHWTGLAAGLATVYASLVGLVYITILTVVVPMTDQGRLDEVAVLEFDDQGSFFQAVDGLGYFVMSLATLAAANALRSPTDRWLRWTLVVNGVLGVPILISYMPLVFDWSELLLPLNALWIITVPACGVLLALRFRAGRGLSGQGLSRDAI